MLWTSIHHEDLFTRLQLPAAMIQNEGIRGQGLIVSQRTTPGVAWTGAGVAGWRNDRWYSLYADRMKRDVSLL